MSVEVEFLLGLRRAGTGSETGDRRASGGGEELNFGFVPKGECEVRSRSAPAFGQESVIVFKSVKRLLVELLRFVGVHSSGEVAFPKVG